MKRRLKDTVGCRGQSNLIAVMLLVSVSLVIGLGIASLFVSQSAVIREQQDINEVVIAEGSNEDISLVYYGYAPEDEGNPAGDYVHKLIFRLTFVSRGPRDYFLLTPLITEGSVDYLRVDYVRTAQLWNDMELRKLVPNASSGEYVELPVDSLTLVRGDDVFLKEGMNLALDQVPIYRVVATHTSPYSGAYILIEFEAPYDWNEGLDLTLVTFTRVGNQFFELNRYVVDLGGSG